MNYELEYYKAQLELAKLKGACPMAIALWQDLIQEVKEDK